ncbi:twin-arginine translocase TatA/TatE family subunit [Acidocella aminolytica]|jgi:sec-independent protein translocase protein TatA|uniref:Sec-independent protein translocase protein TatA n=1 Tax=Acidocella aminolytica 101 = DSM 11237 TaxID=1120923 RepID=A0A0D6PD71_9PROT|nr:twin-arginine translocase TatA/TatE family subunit [Acidocella aminolytica]GAN79306.1 Sec-independent protein translocase protein TatA/E-like protein [Acidocella aminolytica 101 = DSM 11237]GBQ39578.1 Sec-independent protein translocase protein TatA [Acidocella aminolytica 101 = DSM 11237]SHE38007.1 sec-independent protein translocase protein TatA [Acidocella aminolytica 101 = DSM 11237]
MGGLSIWHWLIVLVVALLLLGGRGRVSSMMGDLGKGIKSFKQSMAEDEPAKPEQDAKMSEPGALNAPLPEQNSKTTVNHQG